MKVFITTLTLLLLLSSPAWSRCTEDDVAYYHLTHNSVGARITSLFLFPFTAAITVMTVPVYRKTGNTTVTGKAACMVIANAAHASQGNFRRNPR
jgi:hypothetical protein